MGDRWLANRLRFVLSGRVVACMAVALLAVAVLHVPAVAQAPAEAEPPDYGGIYHGLRFTFAPASQTTYELGAAYGPTIVVGARGTWMFRVEVAGGVNAWSEVATENGYFAGGRLSGVRVFTGDYLYLGAPFEFFLSAGSGFYYAWNTEEAQGERNLIPLLTGGVGFRSRAGRSLPTLGIHYERRFGDWNSRVSIAIGLNFPW
ncbi:MAG TPA: hypothetical protein VNZ57_14075 [Longimicrobiales bacterium]|nr:hypothetical protein [Longimicrobiales bacterium]